MVCAYAASDPESRLTRMRFDLGPVVVASAAAMQASLLQWLLLWHHTYCECCFIACSICILPSFCLNTRALSSISASQHCRSCRSFSCCRCLFVRSLPCYGRRGSRGIAPRCAMQCGGWLLLLRYLKDSLSFATMYVLHFNLRCTTPDSTCRSFQSYLMNFDPYHHH